jgi:hypothetical protein
MGRQWGWAGAGAGGVSAPIIAGLVGSLAGLHARPVLAPTDYTFGKRGLG